MKLRSVDGGELMEISSLERDGNQLLLRGKVFGAMPLEVWSASTVLLGAAQWIAGHRRAGRATMHKVWR